MVRFSTLFAATVALMAVTVQAVPAPSDSKVPAPSQSQKCFADNSSPAGKRCYPGCNVKCKPMGNGKFTAVAPFDKCALPCQTGCVCDKGYLQQWGIKTLRCIKTELCELASPTASPINSKPTPKPTPKPTFGYTKPAPSIPTPTASPINSKPTPKPTTGDTKKPTTGYTKKPTNSKPTPKPTTVVVKTTEPTEECPKGSDPVGDQCLSPCFDSCKTNSKGMSVFTPKGAFCPGVCARGCVCDKAHIQNWDYKAQEFNCIPLEGSCAYDGQTTAAPSTCTTNAHLATSAKCESSCVATCDSNLSWVEPSKYCPKMCYNGCLCNKGFIKFTGKNGEMQCIPEGKCTKPTKAFCKDSNGKNVSQGDSFTKDYCSCYCMDPVLNPEGKCDQCKPQKCDISETQVKIPYQCCKTGCVSNKTIGICKSDKECCPTASCHVPRGGTFMRCVSHHDSHENTIAELKMAGKTCPTLSPTSSPTPSPTNGEVFTTVNPFATSSPTTQPTQCAKCFHNRCNDKDFTCPGYKKAVCTQDCNCNYDWSINGGKIVICKEAKTTTAPQYDCEDLQYPEQGKVEWCCKNQKIGCDLLNATTCRQCVAAGYEWQAKQCSVRCMMADGPPCRTNLKHCEQADLEDKMKVICPKHSDCVGCTSDKTRLCKWTNSSFTNSKARCVMSVAGFVHPYQFIERPKQCPIPTNAFCKDNTGSNVKQGAKWMNGPCTQCTCVDPVKTPNGTCYTQDCPPIKCEDGQMSVVPKGKCCAICQAIKYTMMEIEFVTLKGLKSEDEFGLAIQQQLEGFLPILGKYELLFDFTTKKNTAIVKFPAGAGMDKDSINKIAAGIEAKPITIKMDGQVFTTKVVLVYTDSPTPSPTTSAPVIPPMPTPYPTPVPTPSPTDAPYYTMNPTTSPPSADTTTSPEDKDTTTRTPIAPTLNPDANKGNKVAAGTTTTIIVVVIVLVLLIILVVGALLFFRRGKAAEYSRSSHDNPAYNSGGAMIQNPTSFGLGVYEDTAPTEPLYGNPTDVDV